MATRAVPPSLDVSEQIARIDKMQAELAKIQTEIVKLVAETKVLPRSVAFQAMLATAALLGAGAAIAKLFFP